MLNSGALRAEPSPPPPSPAESKEGEFTRMFNAGRPAAGPGPQFPQAAFPSAPPLAAPAPEARKVGEFTQMFGRHEGAPSPVAPQAPAPSFFPGDGATGAFRSPAAPSAPVAPAGPAGESEYTRMMRAPVATPSGAGAAGASPAAGGGGGMAMPQMAPPKFQAPQVQMQGPQAAMQGANVQAQGPQAHMQGPHMQAPQMQMPPIQDGGAKIPPPQVKPPDKTNILLIVIVLLVGLLLGSDADGVFDEAEIAVRLFVTKGVNGVDLRCLHRGYIPNTTPTKTETPKAITTDAVVTMVFHSAVRAISQARKKPNAMPSRPPPTEISTDSVRNWRTISKRRAPIDRRMPISRVRSRRWRARCS